jgi:hypothetical protein
MAARNVRDTRSAAADGVAFDPVDAGAPAGRREQILQTAQKLFADKGFRETNLNYVATQLGFRRQAVYHYFRLRSWPAASAAVPTQRGETKHTELQQHSHKRRDSRAPAAESEKASSTTRNKRDS